MVYMSDLHYERIDYKKGFRRWTEVRCYNADNVLLWTKKGPSITFRQDYDRLEKIRDILLFIGVWISSSMIGVLSYCILRGL